MNRTLPLLLAALAAACAADGPEAQGVSSQGILDFLDAAEREVDALHGFVLMRHGRVVAEGWWAPFDRRTPHRLYSLSKSFTSTAVGMAVDEGRLRVDDTVLSFFPDDAPADPGENLKAMRVRDLLTMTAGHASDTLPKLTGGADKNWVKTFLSLPVEHKPGTHFLYNTGATYMLSAILQKVTGQTLLDYLQSRLFDPLAIGNPSWESDPRGINVGGWGLKIATSDIARFGQLYLQRGMWNGRRLLSESWIAAASSAQVPNGSNPQSDWNQGYGYQFWRCRHDAYRGDGAFGQYCIVLPEQDAVLAVTSGIKDMQKFLNLVWKHLRPAMRESPLPPDEANRTALAARLGALAHPRVQGEATSPLAAKVSGKRFALESNNAGLQAVTFHESRLILHGPAGDQEFRFGPEPWLRQTVTFHKLGMSVVATSGPETVAAGAAWPAPDRFALRAWLPETPYRLDIEVTFGDTEKGLVLKQKLHPLQAEWIQIKGAP